MIRISIGNVGSGKTANEVREMMLNKTGRVTFSNILTKIKHQVNIDPSMIIKEQIVDHKKNKKTGKNEPVYKYTLNVDFWKKVQKKYGAVNVVIDEAHSIINSRRSFSKINIIVNDWIALIRRVLGESSSGYGELVFITQLPNRIDLVAREMAHQIRYHLCHYRKVCLYCNTTWTENSDMPEVIWRCPSCNKLKIKKFDHKIEIFHFDSMQNFYAWKHFGEQAFYNHYLVSDIEDYFNLYDTLQWDNLFSKFYD